VSRIYDKNLFPYISRAVNSSFVRFDIIYKKGNNLLNKSMNIKKNQSFKTVIQFFKNPSSSRTVFNLFNSSKTYNTSSSGTLNLDE
jgi:hypothetical protein